MQATAPIRTEVLPGIWLDGRLGLWFAAARLLVAADLHWGYAVSHRARGNLLPLWGDERIETRLEDLVADYAPAEMIWLGDSLHAREGRAQAERYLASSRVPITVIAGNHDRSWRQAALGAVQRGRYFFHHGDQGIPVPAGCLEVIGHHHPALAWSDGAGGRLKLPALVASERRLILPAFSPWAAGAPWNSRLGAGERMWGVGGRRILPFAAPAAVVSA